jgi:quinol monooxygenase YgiN
MKTIGMVLMALAMMGVVSCKGGKKCCGKEGTTECAEATAAVAGKGKKVVVARVAVKDGQEAAFIEIALTLVKATRTEEGNLFYSVYQSPANPTEFIFYEEYKDDAAFQTHASSAHFATFAEGIKDLTAGDFIIDEF